MKFRSGYRVVKTLRKYINGKPTNITKANVLGQQDYIERYLSDDCPVNPLPSGVTQNIVNATPPTMPNPTQTFANDKTLSFSQYVQGWTTFHSWIPESMVNMNGDFYTFKSGQLYKHHKDGNERNVFYGTPYSTEIEFIVNKDPSSVKMFRSMKTEGSSNNWNITVTTDTESGFINKETFQKKEEMYYAYIRNNNTSINYKKLSVQGIGVCDSVNSGAISLTVINMNNESLSIGDKLLKADISNNKISNIIEIGVVSAVSANAITCASFISAPAIGDFIFSAKNQTAESEGVRGYHASVRMTNDSTSPVELFAVDSEVTKSNL